MGYRGSFHCLYIHHQEWNVARNMNVKGDSGEISEMRKIFLVMGGKVFLVIKWQTSWQNHVLVLGRRYNL